MSRQDPRISRAAAGLYLAVVVALFMVAVFSMFAYLAKVST